MSDIASRFKDWMLKNELTTTKILNDTGISKSNISDWYRGNKLPSSKALIKLYDTYKLPINYILTGQDLDIEERLLLDIYNKLNDTNKKKIAIEIRKLYEIQQLEN